MNDNITTNNFDICSGLLLYTIKKASERNVETTIIKFFGPSRENPQIKLTGKRETIHELLQLLDIDPDIIMSHILKVTTPLPTIPKPRLLIRGWECNYDDRQGIIEIAPPDTSPKMKNKDPFLIAYIYATPGWDDCSEIPIQCHNDAGDVILDHNVKLKPEDVDFWKYITSQEKLFAHWNDEPVLKYRDTISNFLAMFRIN